MTGMMRGGLSSLAALVPWRFRSVNNLMLASPNALFAGVRNTPPQQVQPASGIEVHALVCKRDVNMMLTSAKSLLRFCPPVALILHDDGSLEDRDCELFITHIPGTRIIRRSEADAAMRSVLSKEVFEKRQKHFFLLKLFDCNYFNQGTHTVLLDSDILFLKRPDEVIAWMQETDPAPFYNRDPLPSYRANRVPGGLELPQHLNAGFMGFKGRFDLQEIARWGFELDYWLEDQTFYAVLLAGQGASALDCERYRVYMGEPITGRTAMVHFISPKRFDRMVYLRLAWKTYRELRRNA